MYFLEVRGLRAACQSGFRKGRGMMDSVVCLESEVRKAQVNKGGGMPKAYDLMWREGLLIKLRGLGVSG